MKCLTVVGARPQFIKASAVSRALLNVSEIQEVLLHTGQHYDPSMSGIFFSELSIQQPDYNLGIGSGTHGCQTGKMLMAIEEVLLQEQPDWVIVYGDTNSTLAGALAASKLHISVAHVEAGLRSFNRQMPEEINRVLTDHISEILYAPTKAAADNLRREGISEAKIKQVGDVMYDASLFFAEKVAANQQLLTDRQLSAGYYILATVHRAENTDDSTRLRAIFDALIQLNDVLPVVLPLHPRTRKALETIGLIDQVMSTLRLLPPVGYLDMLSLEKQARLIVTDSGGVQKEAFFQRVPCITLRQQTEWVELIDLGWNTLIDPSDEGRIADRILTVLEQGLPLEDEKSSTLYGGGTAAMEIAAHLKELGGL